MRLNKQQKLAIDSTRTDIVVLACAGSGKTEVLTQRIIRLLQDGISPREICAVTFTRKAALELRERLFNYKLAAACHFMRIGTFHSLCLEMIESYPVTAGYGHGSKLVVYDEEDKASIIKDIKAKVGKKAPDEIVEAEYLSILERHTAIDYDIMVAKAWGILRNNASAQDHYHNKFRYLFVDEFQDTDLNQASWINLLQPQNLFVVGDDDQNIYGWRGTEVDLFRAWQACSDRETIILPRNYRSTPEIINTANAVIHKDPDPDRIEKTMIPSSAAMKRPGKVDFFTLPTASSEGYKIGSLLIQLKQLRQSPPNKEIAILGRTNRQLDDLCEYLSDVACLPVERIGRKNDLWKKPGWRLCANILRLLYSPWDAHVYKAIRIELGLFSGPNLEQEILKNTIKGVELWHCYDDVLGKAFNRAISKVEEVEGGPLVDTESSFFLADILCYANVSHDYSIRHLGNRIGHLEKMQKWLQKKDWSIEKFVQWFNFREVQDGLEDSDTKNTVKLMTVHVAKGLEFEAVIIPWCNDDTWPNRRSDRDEERRLFYVAITRAKSYLYFTRAEEDPRGKPTAVSPFMDWK